MTNEEAKVFLDNLKICIEEHPIIADWLIEIADRKTDLQTETKTETQNSNLAFEKADEPQTCSFSDCDNFKNPDYERCIECKRKQIKLKTEQTERSE